MFLWILTIVAGLCYIFRTFLLTIWKRGTGELPPGPFPLPILGNVLSLNSDKPYVAAENLAKQYGKVFSLLLGNQLTVFISDVNLVRKAFKDERFSGRPRTVWNILGFNDGLVLSEGEVYKEHRRFSIHALKDYGFGNTKGESFIQKEAADLMKIFRDTNGQPFDNYIPFSSTVSNVMSYMLFGDRFNTEDERFVQYLVYQAENFRDAPTNSPVEIFPWLRFIPPYRQHLEGIMKRVRIMLAALQVLIDEHKQTFDPAHPRDYIDAFLVAQKNGEPSFTDSKLLENIVDLYGASIETTSTFLRWAMLYMMLHPEVQTKAREEIDRVLGSRPVCFADRSSLPYIEATIHEIFRVSKFGPFLLPHKTTIEVDFEGYVLPKDTSVIALLWHIERDPLLWKDSEKFMPERFLTPEGTIDAAIASNMIIFSVGKRVCPGEQLARMEALIIFTSILQNFVISSEGEKPPSAEPQMGLTLTPLPYQMRATARK